ncbi:ergothioneine biosynthesis glutamate--cysteine ligase EgtA [Frankia gtarii]|uniref:ergothioneine biosynthesis glutamate--cysteine ligase EgtA n=1 Tax=Frankia gtarii TaxID=2950102 RepID=UPI0021BFFB9C|nr:ergothioneine biosynthesis glutamate--cysteine ligase EgtA [Frankia gtarii]
MPRHVTLRGSGDDEPPSPHRSSAAPSPGRQSSIGHPCAPSSPESAHPDQPVGLDAVRAFAAGCVTPAENPADASELPVGIGTSVGIETEWFVVDSRAVHRPVPPARTRRALDRIVGLGTGAGGPVLPGGSRLTFEPGGQLELSGPPAGLAAAVQSTAADLRLVRAALAEDGLAVVGMGVDPLRAGVRQTTASRYAAMEEHFRTGGGTSGEVMMCSTASVQVNLDLGATPAQAVERFRLAHEIGPVLTAMFAASPALAGRRTGWRSTRQAVWSGIDASRTRSVLDLPATAAVARPDDLVERWARYLLDAKLMMIADPARDVGPGEDRRFVPVTGGHTFGNWVAGRGPVERAPTLDDLSYHATTVFPPVRPRGWWELRYLDAQPGEGWRVAVAVATALLDDPIAAGGAAEACAPVARRWPAAAMLGMADEPLRLAAVRCLELAAAALRRAGCVDLAEAVDTFAERYPQRGRCPADELSERFTLIGPTGLLREEAQLCVSVA